MKNERFVPDIFKTLGKNIKKIRILENMSQEELAEKVNKSSHLISLLETGRCGISVPTIIDICHALNVDANSIFADIIYTENNNKPNDILLKAYNSFDENDRDMISYLINYINSKN